MLTVSVVVAILWRPCLHSGPPGVQSLPADSVHPHRGLRADVQGDSAGGDRGVCVQSAGVHLFADVCVSSGMPCIECRVQRRGVEG